MHFDYIVVGSGFAGATIAERISAVLGKKVLVVESRCHIGGNSFDMTDEHGVLIHKYGPHIFHTKLRHVWDYLSQFTDWNLYHHKVLGNIDGIFIPIPFNYRSLFEVFPSTLAERIASKLDGKFGFNVKLPILRLLEEDDDDLRFLANFIYEKIFLNYTMKQWGVTPEEIDSSVTGRVPVHLSHDDRYFQDKYQAMPKHGYTKMFEKMLFRKNIHVMLNTDYKDIIDVTPSGEIYAFGQPFAGKLIYTGPIDYFYDYRFGKLPYRSLSFQFENYHQEFYQAAGTVNYPNDYDFTRITEFKHLTSQKSVSTTIVKEFPEDYDPNKNSPYYPIKNSENHKLYRRYLEENKHFHNVLFVGRLAEYQYYDMDAVVSKALKVFSERLL